jgi:hypothetical protein
VYSFRSRTGWLDSSKFLMNIMISITHGKGVCLLSLLEDTSRRLVDLSFVQMCNSASSIR